MLSATRSMIAKFAGTRHVKRSRERRAPYSGAGRSLRPALSSRDIARAGSKPNEGSVASYAQYFGHSGPDEGVPWPCRTELINNGRSMAAFNARRTVGDEKGAFAELKAIRYWYRRSNETTCTASLLTNSTASAGTSVAMSTSPRSRLVHAVRKV